MTDLHKKLRPECLALQGSFIPPAFGNLALEDSTCPAHSDRIA